MAWGMSLRAELALEHGASGPRVSEPTVSASSNERADLTSVGFSGNTGRAADAHERMHGGQYDDRHDGLVPGRQRSGNRSSPGGQIGLARPVEGKDPIGRAVGSAGRTHTWSPAHRRRRVLAHLQ